MVFLDRDDMAAKEEPPYDPFVRLRTQFHEAEHALLSAVRDACPGPHVTVTHRDRKRPWCHNCGRDNFGYLIGEVKA